MNFKLCTGQIKVYSVHLEQNIKAKIINWTNKWPYDIILFRKIKYKKIKCT